MKFEVVTITLVLATLFTFISLDSPTQPLESPTLLPYENTYLEDEIYVKFKKQNNIITGELAQTKINNQPSLSKISNTNKNLIGKATQPAKAERVTSLKLNKELKEIHGLDNLYRIKLDKGTNIDKLLSELNKDPSVEYAEKIPVYEPLIYVPNDYYLPWQWTHNNTGNNFNGKYIACSYSPSNCQGDQPVQDADLDLFEAWDLHTGSPDILIAYGDQHFELDHPDFIGQYEINENEIPNNGIDDDLNGYIDDYHGYSIHDQSGNFDDLNCQSPGYCHGAFVTTYHASTNNSIGMSGICLGCEALLVEAIGGSPGLPYAIDRNASIFSSSWKGSQNVPPAQWKQDLINTAHDSGMVIVSSYGNGCNPNINQYGCGLDQFGSLPIYNHVIGVPGTNTADKKAWYSSYGSAADVAAPGDDLHSIMYNDIYSDDFNSPTGFASGTSLAGPIVANVAGLIKSMNKNLTPNEIESILQTSADLPSSDEFFIGNGRVNAHKALLLTNDSLNHGSFPVSLIDWRIEKNNNLLTVNGTSSSPDFVNYSLEYGIGNYPTNWINAKTSNTPQPNNNYLGNIILPSFIEETIVSIRLITYDSNLQFSKDHVAILVNSTQNDGTPPQIINAKSTKTTHNKTTFIWETNELSKGEISYGNQSGGPYPNKKIIEKFLKNHDHFIENLTANRTYYAQLVVEDSFGNSDTQFFNFNTLPNEDLENPSISNITSNPNPSIILKDLINITAIVTDNTELDKVILEVNNSINYTMQLVDEQSSIYFHQINSYDFTPGNLDYKIIAVDPSNNINISANHTLTINPTCILLDAYWNPGTIILFKELWPTQFILNENASIIIESIYCNGNEELNIEIREDDIHSTLSVQDFDSADITNIFISSQISSNNFTNITWKSIWLEDHNSLGKDPEYVFRASLPSSPIQNMYIDSNNFLKVTGGDNTPPEITSIYHNIENDSDNSGYFYISIEYTLNEYAEGYVKHGNSPDNLTKQTFKSGINNIKSAFFSLIDFFQPADYYYQIVGWDENENNVTSQIIKISLPPINDTSPPSISNFQILPSSTINKSDIILISADVTDNQGISFVRANFNGKNYTLFPQSNNLTFSTNKTNTSIPGEYQIKIITEDTSRNYFESQFRTLTILDPEDQGGTTNGGSTSDDSSSTTSSSTTGTTGGSGTQTPPLSDQNNNENIDSNENILDLSSTISIERILSLGNYQLIIVPGIYHTLSINSIQDSLVIISIDELEYSIPINNKIQTVIDGFYLEAEYLEKQNTKIKIRLTRVPLNTFEFKEINILLTLLTILAIGMAITTYLIRKKQNTKDYF